MRKISISNPNDTTTIYLHGELTRSEVKKYNKSFLQPDSDINVSLKYVHNIDSAGVGFLLKLYKSVISADNFNSIHLIDVSSKIRVILELTQVDQILEIIDNNNQQIAIAS